MVNLVVRFFLGLGSAVIGQQFANRFLNISSPWLVALAALAFGAVGVFIVPIVSVWIRNWTANFSSRIANEIISQLKLPNITGQNKNKSKKRENKREIYPNPIVVDTSALIDGRIADVVELGFLTGTLIVPKFVLSELQHIADASDALRRGKGRRGLDILEALKKSKVVKTVIDSTNPQQEKDIDSKLLALAKSMKGKILTTDFNLNKVATVNGVKVLNINELVNALKTNLLPGEIIEVKVVQQGKEKEQGVGYLQDGTMIVVEKGADFVGKTVQASVTRVLQTVAGRMIFTQIPSDQKQN